MTFQLALQISANGSSARAEMEQVARSTSRVKAEVAGLGRQGAATEAEFASLRSELAGYKAQLDAVAASEARAVAQIRTLTTQVAQLEAQLGRGAGRGGTGAAGAVGNLTAQFNDIGMMMAAGQNPLQLAIQQGSQITQVIGPMGAAGAARALGSAFLGMLNPVSLVTMGAIAAGAAVVQWLTSADEEAMTLEDAVSDLVDVTDAYKAALDRALTPMWKLRQEFGDQAEAVRDLYQAQATLARLDAMLSMQQSVASVTAEFEGLHELVFRLNSMSIEGGPLSGRALASAQQQVAAIKDEFGLTVAQATQLDAGLQALGQATGPKEAGDALAQMIATLMTVHNEAGEIPTEIARVAREMANAEMQARNLAGPLAEAEAAAADLASIDMASGISAAAGEALLLADRLGIALSTARAITGAAAEARAAAGPALGFGFGPVDTGSAANNPDVPLSFGPNPGVAPTRNNGYEPPAATRSSRGGGGGASAAMNDDLREAERLFEATRTAAEKYDAELARINELYKEGHISAETQARAIEMIGEKYLEAGDAAKFFEDITDDLKDAILDLAVDGAASFDKIAASIARAAWQATLFGEGPLAGLFGTSGGGGLLGGLFSSLSGTPAHADGGLITGPGTGRSDSILARVSNGEYIVNADATARHRGLLEAINRGSLPGFAAGGLVGAVPPPGGGLVGERQGAEAPLVRIAVSLTEDLNARIDERSGRVAVQVSGETVRQFARKGLPDQVQRIVNDRRVR